MNIFTDFDKDTPGLKPDPGSYEWWYFDGESIDGSFRFVIIFYDGNPFSSRYIQNMENRGKEPEALAKLYPAISISVYQNNKPIFYSLSEYPPEACTFAKNRLDIKIGHNFLSAYCEDGDITYTLSILEELPSGDRLNADLTFKSEECATNLLSQPEDNELSKGHVWNLTQPKANVSGRIYIYEKNRLVHRIKMAGFGYHDHNLGKEPMKVEFVDWYWGRFHFDQGTLIYYIMNTKAGPFYKAWLISPFNQKCLMRFEDIKISEPQLNRFLLSSKRKIEAKNSLAQVCIYQNEVLDSGPFYMRFAADAILNSRQDNSITKCSGITEYIKPSRIHSRVFWPLVNMRRRYVGQKPHWVQRSPKLYRWTW